MLGEELATDTGNLKAKEVSMRYKTIVLEKSEGIAILTLNRPRKLNAMDAQMMRELQAAIQDVGEDHEVRVLVITGAGSGFSTGGDVDSMRDAIVSESWEETPALYRLQRGEPWYSIVLQVRRLLKPVIAAVNGIAVGGGLVLAMAADVRIASDKAAFSQMFARRGLPDGASTYFLPKLVGIGKACELAFMGDVIDAKEAERIGLVNKVVPHQDLMKVTMQMATHIANGPAIALQLAKQALHRGFIATDLASHIEYELGALLMCTTTEDFKEGIRSFLEKREPTFRGR